MNIDFLTSTKLRARLTAVIFGTAFGLLPLSCGPLATLFAPPEASMVVMNPGAAPERAPSGVSETATPTPTATIVHGQGGGKALQEIGSVLPPPFGTILSVIGGVAGTAATIYMASQNSKIGKTEKVLTAVIEGIHLAGDTAAAVRKAVQAQARTAGPAVAGYLEYRVTKVKDEHKKSTEEEEAEPEEEKS